MAFTEQIQVYKQVPVPNNSGGFTTTAVIQANAPTWADIQQTAGDQNVFSTRDELQRTFRLTCRWRNDFTWDNDMYAATRFGNLQVTSVVEDIRKKQVVVIASVV